MKVILALAVVFLCQTTWAAKKQIWVYTSIYKEYAGPLKAGFEAKHPDVEVQIFQGGSEKIQAKVEAELLASSLQADVILTSDPFWASDIKRRGLAAAADNDGTNYYSLMVLICNKSLPANQRPKSFADLVDPRFKSVIQTGSPLESGTAFSSVAYLSKKYGWDFFKKLRANGVASNGGNATVIEKVESGEKKVGMVLLENALASIKRGSPIEIIYPEDGSIPIPSVQIVLKNSKQREAAKEFADFVLSRAGQEVLRTGFMYSVRKDVADPEGAKPFVEVTKKSTPWTPDLLLSVSNDAKKIKKQFEEIVLE